jgi:hypothetical protein
MLVTPRIVPGPGLRRAIVISGPAAGHAGDPELRLRTARFQDHGNCLATRHKLSRLTYHARETITKRTKCLRECQPASYG